MRKLIATAMATMLLLTACTTATPPITERDEALTAAVELLGEALGEIYLYQGEIVVNKEAEPHFAADGRKYYPVMQYLSIAELRQHSRKVFTEDFCANVLDGWAQNPNGSRFVEYDGKLWETNSVGNMGWIILQVSDTIELVSLQQERCVVSAYSQVLTGEVTRDEFLMLREPDGWRLDSYYHINRTLPAPEMVATVEDYLAGMSDGDSELYRLAVVRNDGSTLDVDNSMIPPFASILAALEYNEDTVATVETVPTSPSEDAGLELMLYSGSCELSGFDDGSLYITGPDGVITKLEILYPGGIKLLSGVITAARWKLRDFGV